MSDHKTTAMEGMAHLAGEMTEAALAGQAAGLRVLMAEMQALAQLIPAAAGLSASHVPQSQAEIEADFDNMPV